MRLLPYHCLRSSVGHPQILHPKSHRECPSRRADPQPWMRSSVPVIVLYTVQMRRSTCMPSIVIIRSANKVALIEILAYLCDQVDTEAHRPRLKR